VSIFREYSPHPGEFPLNIKTLRTLLLIKKRCYYDLN
jgi:hypothetical protein